MFSLIYTSFNLWLLLTSTVVFTIIALSEFSLAASLLPSRTWLSTIVSDLPPLSPKCAERKPRVCFELPVWDLGAELLLRVSLWVVTSGGALLAAGTGLSSGNWPLTLLVGIVVNVLKSDVYEACVPRCEKDPKARQRCCNQVAVHFQLRHSFGEGVSEGQIVCSYCTQADEANNRYRSNEESQRECGDNNRLWLRVHLQAPDQVYGESRDHQVCYDTHGTRCSPSCEYRLPVGVSIAPRL